MMKHFLTALAVTFVIAAGIAAATAQLVPQVSNPAPPVPQPPPPPPPSMAVPPVPKLDAPPSPPPRADGRRSFNERIERCLTDATVAGLNVGERAAYSRACANQL